MEFMRCRVVSAKPSLGRVRYGQEVPPPVVKGLTHVSLSVTDLDVSLPFYRDLLGLPVLVDTFDGSAFAGREAMVLAGRIALCLQCHHDNIGSRFDPLRTGLDHLALGVSSLEDLHAFATHLDAHGVEHSRVKPLTGFGHVIELCDPDGIQIEIHAPQG